MLVPPLTVNVGSRYHSLISYLVIIFILFNSNDCFYHSFVTVFFIFRTSTYNCFNVYIFICNTPSNSWYITCYQSFTFSNFTNYFNGTLPANATGCPCASLFIKYAGVTWITPNTSTSACSNVWDNFFLTTNLNNCAGLILYIWDINLSHIRILGPLLLYR